jgi:hypothetical protein
VKMRLMKSVFNTRSRTLIFRVLLLGIFIECILAFFDYEHVLFPSYHSYQRDNILPVEHKNEKSNSLTTESKNEVKEVVSADYTYLKTTDIQTVVEKASTIEGFSESEDDESFEVYSSFIPENDSREVPRGEIVPGLTEFYQPEWVRSANCMNQSHWSICDPPICNLSSATKLETFKFEKTTIWNESIYEYMNRLLKYAWGRNPPRIDLYVRTGCKGLGYLSALLQSVELFWPRFLGDILIVLDYNDQPIIDRLFRKLKYLSRHSVKIIYEHNPCFTGRVFNQYSYVHFEQYSTAEYTVTIDSDCALMRPFVPDVLFVEHSKKVRYFVSKYAQRMWFGLQEFITKVKPGKYGHGMIVQPVTVINKSLKPFREWIAKQHNLPCYEDVISLVLNKWENTRNIGVYCWMCQLSPFASIFASRFNYETVEISSSLLNAKWSYVAHTKYQNYLDQKTEWEMAQVAVIDGLCVWFGNQYFTVCKERNPYRQSAKGYVQSVERVLQGYWRINSTSMTQEQYKDSSNIIRDRLLRVAELAKADSGKPLQSREIMQDIINTLRRQ